MARSHNRILILAVGLGAALSCAFSAVARTAERFHDAVVDLARTVMDYLAEPIRVTPFYLAPVEVIDLAEYRAYSERRKQTPTAKRRAPLSQAHVAAA